MKFICAATGQLPSASQHLAKITPQERSSPFKPLPTPPTDLYTRRDLGFLAASLAPLLLAHHAAAVTLEEVTPAIAPPAALTQREQQVADTFARCNPSVATIFDVTLSGRIPSGPGSVEQAEGNGSGFVFDAAGHVVTNYHVLTNVLGGAAGKVQPMAKVAVVYLLGASRSSLRCCA